MYINNFVSTIDKDRLSGKISRNIDPKSKFIQLQFTVQYTVHLLWGLNVHKAPIFLKLYSLNQGELNTRRRQ